jgi:hypothetical protein
MRCNHSSLPACSPRVARLVSMPARPALCPNRSCARQDVVRLQTVSRRSVSAGVANLFRRRLVVIRRELLPIGAADRPSFLRALHRPQHGIAHFPDADALATLLPDVAGTHAIVQHGPDGFFRCVSPDRDDPTKSAASSPPIGLWREGLRCPFQRCRAPSRPTVRTIPCRSRPARLSRACQSTSDNRSARPFYAPRTRPAQIRDYAETRILG